MKVGVLGAGRMGRAMAARLISLGHQVKLGSRTARPVDPVTGALGTMTYASAASGADLVVLTTEGADCAAALAAAGPLDGMLLLDCTNPDRPDGHTLAVGRESSLGEQNARAVPGARVVKALNHVWAESVEDPGIGARRPAALVCGDDEESKGQIVRLLVELGFTPVDVGGLISARYTEPLAVLTVSMVTGLGWNPLEVELQLAGAASRAVVSPLAPLAMPAASSMAPRRS